MSHTSASDRDAFEQLVESIAARIPNQEDGYTERDIPRLKEADIAVCLDAIPDLTDDFLATNGSLGRDMAACLRGEGAFSVQEYLAAAFFAYITKECKKEIARALVRRWEDAQVNA